MKVALVHDYLNQNGGAEKVLAAIADLFPRAPIYTLLYDPQVVGREFSRRDIRTSWLQRMPFARRHYAKYLPFFPLFVENMDLSAYDLVVSDSSAWAKGVLTFAPTVHVSYLHTPMRFAWDYFHPTVGGTPLPLRGLLAAAMNYLRVWDVVATRRVDFLACNSRTVQERIRKYYGRGAEVIPPPVDTAFYTPPANGHRPAGVPAEPYFLTVCRLKPYKKVNLAVEAFRGLDSRLVVVGEGPEREALRKAAGPNVTFVPAVDDEAVRDYYRYASAFIMPAYEDFGIAPVEAMACGTPVIAFRRGGALDTVIDGITGCFFPEQTADALCEAVRSFDPQRYDAAVIRNHAVRYDRSWFKARFAEFVWACYEKARRRSPAETVRPVPRAPRPAAEAAAVYNHETV